MRMEQKGPEWSMFGYKLFIEDIALKDHGNKWLSACGV